MVYSQRWHNYTTLRVYFMTFLSAMNTKARQKFAKSLGKKIREVRLERGYSLKHFEAKQYSIDLHALSKIELGKTVPSVYTLYKIAAVLQVPLGNLLPNSD